MKFAFIVIVQLSLLSGIILGQNKKLSIPLVNNKDLVSFNVIATEETYSGKESLKVIDHGEDTELKFVKINNLNFKNGTIEGDLTCKSLKISSEQPLGVLGIAFRINNDNSKFECIYIRPDNSRSEDQVRRNHTVQYISYPDFPRQKLRKNFPEKYESYVDLVPGKWIKIKVEIIGEKAKLYVNGNKQPTLIINDLKLGPDNRGDIGLWIGDGTEAHFANLKVTKFE